MSTGSLFQETSVRVAVLPDYSTQNLEYIALGTVMRSGSEKRTDKELRYDISRKLFDEKIAVRIDRSFDEEYIMGTIYRIAVSLLLMNDVFDDGTVEPR